MIDCKIIHADPNRPQPGASGPAVLRIGDTVALGAAGEDNEPLLEGAITEVFAGDRYKVEITDIDGQTYRYSVPRDLIILVRRADA